METNPTDARQALQRLDAESAIQQQSAPASMMAIIARAASDPSVDVTKMERLMAMQERIVARDAELAFNAAMRDVQSKVRYVKKDAKNAQTNSSYAKLETISKAIVPVATEHGFSLSYGTADCPLADHIRVTCQVLHAAGHSRQYQVDVPIDILGMKGNPSKTRTHGFGSSLTYGRRYLTLLIFNLSTGDDDDGNAAGGSVEGPEVLIGLKSMLWQLMLKHGKVAKGQNWDAARQYLVDEMLIDQDVPIADLTVAAWRKALVLAQKKLEAAQ